MNSAPEQRLGDGLVHFVAVLGHVTDLFLDLAIHPIAEAEPGEVILFDATRILDSAHHGRFGFFAEVLLGVAK